MKNKEKENAMKYLDEQEPTDVSFLKIGSGSKNLIVSFASAMPEIKFERKKSLFKLKYDDNFDVDMLYMRDIKYFLTGRGRKRTERLIGGWYLDGLNGIGDNINDTILFLKEQTKNYDNIIFIGSSMGGYASILFGSIVNANHVISVNPQTDLDYVIEKTPRDKFKSYPRIKKFRKENPEIWKEYVNLKPHLNKSVNYHLSLLPESLYMGKLKNMMNGWRGAVLHANYHLENIEQFKTVNVLENIRINCPWKQAEDIEATLPSFLI